MFGYSVKVIKLLSVSLQNILAPWIMRARLSLSDVAKISFNKLTNTKLISRFFLKSQNVIGTRQTCTSTRKVVIKFHHPTLDAVILLVAIQIIRDTFLTDFRPPSPMCHLVTLSLPPTPVWHVTWQFTLKNTHNFFKTFCGNI